MKFYNLTERVAGIFVKEEQHTNDRLKALVDQADAESSDSVTDTEGKHCALGQYGDGWIQIEQIEHHNDKEHTENRHQ